MRSCVRNTAAELALTRMTTTCVALPMFRCLKLAALTTPTLALLQLAYERNTNICHKKLQWVERHLPMATVRVSPSSSSRSPFTSGIRVFCVSGRGVSSDCGFEPVSAETQPVSGQPRTQISDIEKSSSRDSPWKSRPSARDARYSSPETGLLAAKLRKCRHFRQNLKSPVRDAFGWLGCQDSKLEMTKSMSEEAVGP
jgi:hypothetical protein